jgi:uncharacterized membrane protein YfcA
MKVHFLQILPLFAIGLCAGFLNGLLGAGGGILIVFGLRKLLKGHLKDPRAIYPTAIAVMLPLSLLSVWQYARAGSLELSHLCWLILPAIAGGAIGALLLRRLSVKALSRIFAAVVFISGLVLVL